VITLVVSDTESSIRLAVLTAARGEPGFVPFLAQEETLNILFIALHDEHFDIRECALVLIGSVSQLNAAPVYPQLRSCLISYIQELSIQI
jgi:serine/threonine-protein kinase mTOR